MLPGAGISTYITGRLLGQMLVNIPDMEHMGIFKINMEKSPIDSKSMVFLCVFLFASVFWILVATQKRTADPWLPKQHRPG